MTYGADSEAQTKGPVLQYLQPCRVYKRKKNLSAKDVKWCALNSAYKGKPVTDPQSRN